MITRMTCLIAAFACALLCFGGCGDDGGSVGGDTSSTLGGGGGGNRSCVALCAEAQAGDCTSIRGDCASFCGAIDASKQPSGCSAQVDAYLACQNASANVCDAPGCEAEEGAVESCYTPYCISNPTDPNCITIASSF